MGGMEVYFHSLTSALGGSGQFQGLADVGKFHPFIGHEGP
jgi:hypothetical protein